MSSSLRNDFDLRDIILLVTKFIYAETRIKLAIDQGDTYYRLGNRTALQLD